MRSTRAVQSGLEGYFRDPLFTRMPDIRSGTPGFQVNNFIHGIHSLPATWTPA